MDEAFKCQHCGEEADLLHYVDVGFGPYGECCVCEARYYASAGTVVWESPEGRQAMREAEASVPDCFGTTGL